MLFETKDIRFKYGLLVQLSAAVGVLASHIFPDIDDNLEMRRLKKAIRSRAEVYQELWNNLVKEYANADGSIPPSHPQIAQWQFRSEELNERIVSVDRMPTISLEHIKENKIPLSGHHLDLLMLSGIVVEEPTKEEEPKSSPGASEE